MGGENKHEPSVALDLKPVNHKSGTVLSSFFGYNVSTYVAAVRFVSVVKFSVNLIFFRTPLCTFGRNSYFVISIFLNEVFTIEHPEITYVSTTRKVDVG